jgi:hypothetical protein
MLIFKLRLSLICKIVYNPRYTRKTFNVLQILFESAFILREKDFSPLKATADA